MRLVADIGGTNARLALSKDGVVIPGSVRSYANDEWPKFDDMLKAYLSESRCEDIAEIVVAVAGPVQDDRALLTNRNWTILTKDLLVAARCERAVLLNDLTALGYSVPALRSDQLTQCHWGAQVNSAAPQSLVVGVGTGFNASPVIAANGAVQCLSVEAGHASMPLSVAMQLNDIGGLAEAFPTVEALFSGRGLSAFCHHISKGRLTGIEAISAYGKPDQQAATAAVDQYADLLGRMLREMALSYMPKAGVYVAGSVGRAILKTAPLNCTAIFAEHSDVRFGKTPDLFIINDDAAALHGCAAVY